MTAQQSERARLIIAYTKRVTEAADARRRQRQYAAESLQEKMDAEPPDDRYAEEDQRLAEKLWKDCVVDTMREARLLYEEAVRNTGTRIMTDSDYEKMKEDRGEPGDEDLPF